MQPLGMTILLVITLGAFTITAVRRWRLMRVAAAPADRFDRPAQRWAGVIKYMFGQARMFRYRGAGIAHALIFAGFVVLLLRSLILLARGYASDPHFGFVIFDDHALLGMAYRFVKDIIDVLVIAGVAYFFYLRIVVRPARMALTAEGIFILLMILGIVSSDLLYDAAGFVREAGYRRAGLDLASPFASLAGWLLASLPPEGVDNIYYLGFWMHSILVLAFLNFLPYGKHFHILTVLPNVYFRNLDGIGRLPVIEDIEGRIEREQTLGIRTVRDLSWKDVLDLYTCTECGRCSDQCPATRTGKRLSPKHLTIDIRDHMYEHDGALIAAARRGDNDAFEPLVPAVVHPEVIWACTTCGACEQECPVFISYIDKIVGLRRHQVMEAGEFPEQLQTAFRGLETVGNPYSFDNGQRAAWAEGLDVPLRSEKPDAEYLWWVGCGPSFDDRSRRIARAFAKLLKAAGVDFAILGPEEMCTGDPARRAGNEYLFEILARQNVETLNGFQVRKIITTCPHCYNTLKNEYPAFDGRYEVIHHTELLADLLRSGRLRPEKPVHGTIAYHDSCYLGRYNDVYDPPREILRRIPGLHVVEAKESRDRGMCCGAGGAQMWKEEEPTSREKVNHARARQLLRVLPNPTVQREQTGCRAVATACPFCKTMISDALTDLGHEDVVQKDVAELLAESVVVEAERVEAT